VAVAGYAERFLHRKEWRNKWYGRLAAWFMGTIIISLAAQLGTIPITAFYFKQMSVYFLLTNLIVLPLASLLVPCGLISIALGGSSGGVLFSKLTHTLAHGMNASVEWIEGLPGSTTQVSIGPGMVAIYYFFFICLCLFLMKTSQNH
jgi:competence protein ComEC